MPSLSQSGGRMNAMRPQHPAHNASYRERAAPQARQVGGTSQLVAATLSWASRRASLPFAEPASEFIVMMKCLKQSIDSRAIPADGSAIVTYMCL